MSSLRLLLAVGNAFLLALTGFTSSALPLPEHPRPDFQRAEWQNLNGTWRFSFDADDQGASEGWSSGKAVLPLTITVPFPWGSPLSGVTNGADLAWYQRTITVPESWQGQRVFLVVGACDWLTQGWLDGHALGEHRGGYTPFEFELTPHVLWGREQTLTLRVDDRKHSFKLEGKQGYGEAKGLWQTVYLEARPTHFLQSLHFTPDLAQQQVRVRAVFDRPLSAPAELRLRFLSEEVSALTQNVAEGALECRVDVPIPDARLWTLEDPFLYEVEAELEGQGATDRLSTYFGMRSISVVDLPGLGHPWIALNGKPIYLQLSLDQSYHPGGFYTFPSDEFMRDEMLRARRIGLNGSRFHVKVDVPRKLYWADRLGVLVMADVPNSWGEPDAEMRREIEYALRGMIQRDYNHPAIFAWVPFNETWGLFTREGDQRTYLPDTQDWVASVVRLARSLDPTRLVEDNSPCNFDHVETDINSWHAYLPGYAWREHLDQLTRDTHPGSAWNFVSGRTQDRQPLFNSECGNVWGYEGSTGDVDWSWDYHIMMNEFRRHPKICGWLYTEHHDVINEWNGYYRFDRSEKYTGFDEFVPGMSLRDLHAPYYLSTGSDLCRTVRPGQTIEVPLYASFFTDENPGQNLILRTEFYGWDTLGRRESYTQSAQVLRFQPWMAEELKPLKLRAPSKTAVAVLALTLENEAGKTLHRNFTTFQVASGPSPRAETLRSGGTELRITRFSPASFHNADWTLKQWNILDGLKVNGAGAGFFEYRIPWPEHVNPDRVRSATFVVEASAKRLNGKDLDNAARQEGDFMRGQGTFDPSLNPNAYPMTDTVRFPSAVRIRVNGQAAGLFDLPDDPADSRGILSWHAQLRDRRLREAGSYGYLVTALVPEGALKTAVADKEFVIRLEVDDALAGGLAIYGEGFGRYPIDPTLVLQLQ